MNSLRQNAGLTHRNPLYISASVPETLDSRFCGNDEF